MFLILYHQDTYCELSLEGADNVDHWLYLDAGQYHLRQSIRLHLDVAGHLWTLYTAPTYQVVDRSGAAVGRAALRDGVVVHLKTAGGDRLSLVAVDQGALLPVTHKFAMSQLDHLQFGSGSDNDICFSFQDMVSKHHGELLRRNGALCVSDHSTNGTYRNGRKVTGVQQLDFGDRVQVFGLMMVYLGSVLCIVARGGALSLSDRLPEVHHTAAKISNKPRTAAPAEQIFNRSPRALPEIYRDTVTVEPVPEAHFTKPRPLLLTIGPSFTMALPMLLGSLLAIYGMRSGGMGGSAFMYTGLITALGSATLGVVWGLLNLRQSRREEYLADRARIDAYSNYLLRQAEILREKYTHNAEALNQTYPPVSALCSYDEHTPLLWNRNSNHTDFLFQRLGIGCLPFQVEVEIPKEKFSLTKDLMQEKPAALKKEFEKLQNVPVGIDLKQELLIGVVGGTGRLGCFPVVYDLLAGIAANNCYTDVKIAVVCENGDRQSLRRWDFVKWLPHVWNEGRTARYLAVGKTEASDVFYELSNVLRSRVRGPETASTTAPEPHPYYILFLESPALLEGELIAKYVFAKDPALGLTTVLLSDRCENLPNACEFIIENDNYFTGVFHTLQNDHLPIQFDNVTTEQMEAQARALSSLRVREVESGADIPDRLDFLEMYGANTLADLNAADRWRKNRTYTTMRVPIGLKMGGALCYLDIHEKFHGPHGLVAGTTGSGKSETLQTYILSLAVNFSPEDVGFFIIDFKGGGMANLFTGLPHMLGQISNLSGNQVRRAMISIKSENRRRQRVFNEYGVNSINQYTRLYKNGESKLPVPHLFIIIDEFAELKREEPDFMRELISVAQVGRSLGVHLILATQKPSGTVDDNIWSNSKFRLCLRVQDRQDSNDMLHKPDAAFITQAGRCYLQVGNDEIYEQFQSAWSGAVYDTHGAENGSATAVMLTRTGKAGLIGSRAKLKRRERERLLWLQGLAGELLLHAPAGPCELTAEQRASLTDTIANGPIFTQARLQGSASARRALESFIGAWPAQITNAAEAANRILEWSERTGTALPAPQEKTQLDAIVEYLPRVAADEQTRPVAGLWMPILPTHLTLSALEGFDAHCFANGCYPPAPANWELQAQVGLFDDPENQLQQPLVVDFAAGGHLAVCGSVFSGKSTLLQTLVYSMMMRYPPHWLNFYLLDFSSHMLSPFAGGAHVGAVLDESDIAQIGNFFCMLDALLDQRQKLLKGGNYSQYVRVNGVTLPAIVLVIDNYTAFSEKTEARFEATIMRAAREGVGYGVFLALSAQDFGMGGIPTRIAENLKTVLCLNLGDKFKYMELLRTTGLNIQPENGVPGRGLAIVHDAPLEFQSAAAVHAEDDYARGRLITAECEALNAAWSGPVARPVPRIPDQPTFSALQQEPDYPALRDDAQRLPLGYYQQNAALYALDLSQLYCYSIVGRERSGRANTLKLLMQAAADKKAELVVFDKGATRLQAVAERLNARYLTDGAALFHYWQELTPEFVRRNKLKKAAEARGCTEIEVYEIMKKEPLLCIFLPDLLSWFGTIYKPESGVGDMHGFVENILQKGALHNIYFFGCLRPDDYATLSGWQGFRYYTAKRSGVLLGGNAAAQRLFAFQNISYAQLSKPLKKGIGMAANDTDDTVAEYVVLPLAER